jgi:hypothetical protein
MGLIPTRQDCRAERWMTFIEAGIDQANNYAVTRKFGAVDNTGPAHKLLRRFNHDPPIPPSHLSEVNLANRFFGSILETVTGVNDE